MEVRGQLAEVDSLLPCGVHELNSDVEEWQQVPLVSRVVSPRVHISLGAWEFTVFMTLDLIF